MLTTGSFAMETRLWSSAEGVEQPSFISTPNQNHY